ncbi:MAG: site-specific integrase [Verrucomicrobiota bacterium]
MSEIEHKGQLENELRTALRRCGLSYRTEGSYVGWYKRYVKFHGMRHPNKLGKIDVEKFLADLALNQHVSCSTQSQAMQKRHR